MSEEYWESVIGEVFENHGIEACFTKIKAIAVDINLAADVGREHSRTINRTKPIESKQIEMKICSCCRGTGQIVVPGQHHTGISVCYVCLGKTVVKA